MKRPRILLIDDEADHLLVCRILFEKENYSVSTAQGYLSVEDFFHDISEFRPDLIYIDHEMRGIHSGDIITALRSNPLTDKIPVVYLSAHESIGALAKKYGADDYICKPFDLKHLLQVTERFVGNIEREMNIN